MSSSLNANSKMVEQTVFVAVYRTLSHIVKRQRQWIQRSFTQVSRNRGGRGEYIIVQYLHKRSCWHLTYCRGQLSSGRLHFFEICNTSMQSDAFRHDTCPLFAWTRINKTIFFILPLLIILSVRNKLELQLVIYASRWFRASFQWTEACYETN